MSKMYVMIILLLGMEIHPSMESPTTFFHAKTNIFEIFFGIPSRIRTCNCKCGVPNRQGRLLGGTGLGPYEFPWLSQIHVKGIQPVPATLINDRYVISSATALIGFSPFDVKVEVGRFDTCHADVTSSMLSVSNIQLHPEYQYLTRQNDLALLRLHTFIPYHRRISPICLPTPNQRYTYQVATVASWIGGLASDNRSLSTCHPRKIELPILETSRCSESLAASQGCAGIVGAPSVLCKNDGGAGVLFRSQSGYYELVGVLADKQSCHSPATTAANEDNFDYFLPMFSRVNSHLNWIIEHTRDGCYCNKP